MRLRFASILALALLCLPATAALAQSDEEEGMTIEDWEDMLSDPDGLPQADLGTQDNGWFLQRENGVCRMYSFNDALVIQADASDPLRTRFQFGMIDREIPEAHGTQVQMTVAMRASDDAQFEGFDAVVVASHDMKNYGYLMPVPLGDLVTRYPNGFQLMLVDKNQKPVLKSDTRGSAKHLAELKACARKG